MTCRFIEMMMMRDKTDRGMLFHSRCNVCRNPTREIGFVVFVRHGGSIRPRIVRWDSSPVIWKPKS